MDYILIPVKDKNETDFFMDLMKKMRKEASAITADELEDKIFLSLLKKSEKSGKGSLSKVKSRLSKVAAAK